MIAPTERGLDDLCQALRAEPLFHASLGSKELFHSNLLAWLVEQFPDRAREVFGGWLVPGPGSGGDRVRREFAHLDLVVEFAGNEALVIENKTFALPDEQQLARYTARAVPRLPGNPTLVLLSLMDPGWPKGSATIGGQTWRRVSYQELGQRLYSSFAHDDDFAGQVLCHEAGLLLLLDELFATVGVRHPDEAFRLPDSQARLLTEVNLADAVGKARAHQVGRRIVERLRSEGIPDPAWPVEVGFSNGQPLLAAFWQADEDVYVGWQYQGRQWRLAMILTGDGLKGRGLHASRAEFASLHASYFDFGPLSEVLGRAGQEWLPGKPRRSEGFNRFDPDFVYRYRLMPEMTVSTLVDLAVAYSRRSADWQLFRI